MSVDPNPLEIARHTVEVLQPYLLAAGAALTQGAGEGIGETLFHWLKARLKRPAAAAALEEAARAPRDETTIELLTLQIRKALEEDPELRNELLARLPPIAQAASAVGDQNTIVQSAGSNVSIDIGRRD
ncbi:MAG: hypothetical protein KIT09_06065 [Bryobacteraceae bacterium]|nr:hypothetical protein [Bryobacteraceae bacterium]